MGRWLNEMCDGRDCISKTVVLLIEEMRMGTKVELFILVFKKDMFMLAYWLR